MSDEDPKVYVPGGPEVWRVSYSYQFEQFDTLEKALNYVETNLSSKKKHMLLIQRVNLREVKQEDVGRFIS